MAQCKDCDKCFHRDVCAGDTDRWNYFGECPHYISVDDVVPKSEVEKLSHKCDECAGCTQWKCDCANIELEVAREIFEEIEEEIDRGLFVIKKILNTKGGRANGKTVLISKYDVFIEAKKHLAELKKKYTESEGAEAQTGAVQTNQENFSEEK